jgi:hypothetical protein
MEPNIFLEHRNMRISMWQTILKRDSKSQLIVRIAALSGITEQSTNNL